MIIYKTTNLVNGKFYVGKDVNKGPNYLGSGLLLNRAIEKYGRSNFVKEVLEECTKENINDREIYWIDKLDATNKEIGYNISIGGTGGDTFTNNPNKEEVRKKFRRKMSDETKAKISLNSPHLSGENHPSFGKKQSDETKNKRREAFIERGGFPMSGRSHSEETKEIDRLKHLGKKPSAKNLANIRLALSGKKQEIVTCPHCGKSGGHTMYRWHFDNCKHITKEI